MNAVPLAEARERERFGGKASQLSRALGAGLPVPEGWALSIDLVEAIVGGTTGTEAQWLERLGGAVAVRSSAIDEDGARASFAGQHHTVLGVRTEQGLLEAVRAVRASAHAPSALAYRQRLGITTPPRIAVVVQRMLDPRCAGVLFTTNPVTGADERLIEASWGIGEAIVASLVDPDRIRMARGGRVLEQMVGLKDVAVRSDARGTVEVPVEAALQSRSCLDQEDLAALERLTARCEAVFVGPHDIEWAFVGRDLFLLQRRDVTR